MHYFLVQVLTLCSCSLSLSLGASVNNQLAYLKNLTYDEAKYLNRNLFKTSVDELSLLVYTHSDLNGTEVSFADASNIAELSSFNASVNTVVYIHGWIEDVRGEHVSLVRDSLLNASDYNVLLLNWDECGNSINYIKSWGCVEDTGNYLGQLLVSIRDTLNYSLDSVTLVGHSLGAHISGYAGKYTNGTLGIIVGLDAADPLFFKGQPEHRLNSTDAQFVHVVHTCTQFLGINYNLGDVDFWPNGGHNQAGCGLDAFGQCSHNRAFEYYAESVTSNDFMGRQCENYKNFLNGDCDGNDARYMGGIHIDTSLNGDFFLSTNEESPYGQGEL